VKVAAVLAAALVVAGCGTGAAAPRNALRDNELSWMRSYVSWRDDFERSRAAGAAAAVARCARSFDRSVGDAPSARLRAVERLVRRSCADWRRHGVLVHRFYDENDFDVGPAMSAAEARAEDAAQRAFARLSSLLWESRRLPRIAAATKFSHVQPRYAAAVASITGRPVEIRCWDGPAWKQVLVEAAAFRDVATIDVDGFANFYTGRANLSPTVCGALDDLTYSAARPDRGERLDDIAYGVFVLAHETHHLAGVDSEALATCDGMQDLAQVARRLGADGAYARRLALDYWRRVYPREPPEYRTPACGPDRVLDRTPGDGFWA
jgi:hypothetical protein